MRAFLGPLAVHGALAAAGFGVLRALGVVGTLRSRQALAAGGLAYLVGVAATLPACVIVLVLGGPFNLAIFALVAGGLTALVAVAPRGSPPRLDRRPGLAGPGRWAVLATLGALAVLAVIGLATLGNRPIGLRETDAWHLWTRKALLLYDSPHLPGAIFDFSGDFRYEPHYNISPSYPLLLPLLEALHLRALGAANPSSVHEVLWILMIAFAWAGGFIASRVTSPLVWAPVLAGAVVLSLPRLLNGYADIPLGYFLALGALELGVWLRSGRRGDLVVAALLLTGAANLKNEGTVGVLICLAAAMAVVLATRRLQEARALAVVSALLIALAILPWRLWVAAHHLQTEQPLGRVLNPGFLVDHAGRVVPALHALGDQMGSQAAVLASIVLALVMVLACMYERHHRAAAVFYLLAGGGYLLGLVWAYWVTDVPLAWQLQTSSDRVVVGLAFIAVAALLGLGESQTSGGRPSSL